MSTELGAPDPEEGLGDEDEPLVGAEGGPAVEEGAELAAPGDDGVDVGAGVGELGVVVGGVEGEGVLEGGDDGAAAVERATAVPDAGEEALFEHPVEVAAIEGSPSAAEVGEDLEGGLAVAVLEIGSAEAVAVGTQERLPPGVDDEAEEIDLRGVGLRGVVVAGCRGRFGVSAGTREGPALRIRGSHVRMSDAEPGRPPTSFDGAGEARG